MLCASDLNSIVGGAVGGGVLMAMLLDTSGNTIASAFAGTAEQKDALYAPLVAATANMWCVYAHNGLAMNKLSRQLEADSLEQMIVSYVDKKICAMSVADTAVIALVSLGDSVTEGFLKLKTAAVQRAVDKMLRPVMVELNLD